MDLHELLKNCELEIRAGQINSVRKKLATLNTAQVPRPLRLPLANLCRRTEMLNVGLKLLGAVVRPDRGQWKNEATPHELSEYAVLLQKSGAIREAMWILNQVNPAQAPESLLFRAYCHFNRWEYAEAVDALEDYLNREDRVYQKLVGKVNLASSLLALERWAEALAVVNEMIAQTQASSYARLRANCLELRAQVHFAEGDLARARADLNEAALLAGASTGLDNLLIRKWHAIFEGVEKNSADRILSFRAEAVERRQWESVREADRFALRVQFEPERFKNLLFGTPFPRYRRQILNEHERALELRVLLVGDASGAIFDLQSGKFITPGPLENPSEKTHQLLNVLLMDFYKPFALGALFSELFPGDHFDFHSSQHRVRQLIYRTRRWIEQNGLPLTIEEQEGKYRLVAGRGLGILVPFERAPVDTETVRLESLRAHFGGGEFSSQDACKVLGFSSTSFKSLMSWALEKQLVQRVGAGRSTQYKLVSSLLAAA